MKQFLKNKLILLSLISLSLIYTKDISTINIKYGVDSNIGRRPTMEDAHLAVIPFEAPNSALFAIFDGHGGSLVSNYVAQNFEQVLKNTRGNARERLTQAIETINNDIRNNYMGRREGTCAIIALLEGNKLYVANVGDSRAVLSRNNQALALSEDQSPNRPDETQRIQRAGGLVINNRVQGNLAVSRAIGDFDLSPFVIATPEIREIDIQPNDNFLILSCDGIFERNIISRQNAVDIVRESLQQNQNNPNAAQIASQALVQAAYNKGSGDNLSTIVVLLNSSAVQQIDQPAPQEDPDISNQLISAVDSVIEYIDNIKKYLFRARNIMDVSLVYDFLTEAKRPLERAKENAKNKVEFNNNINDTLERLANIQEYINNSQEKYAQFTTDVYGKINLALFSQNILKPVSETLQRRIKRILE
jgi:serine/threonine protein phosphatase PrpC